MEIEDYKELLKQLRKANGLSASEKATIDIVHHYEMWVRELMGYRGYRATSRENPTEHKNWAYFLKVIKLCEDKGWNPKLYLDAQFDRAKHYWVHLPQKYPLPKQLCAPKAQEYYLNWYKTEQEKRAENVYNTSILAKKTKTYRMEMIEGIVQAGDSMSIYRTTREPFGKFEYILDNWRSIHPAYLWSVGWFRDDYFPSTKEDWEGTSTQKVVDRITKVFHQIDHSKNLQEVVEKAVSMVSQEYNLAIDWTWERIDDEIHRLYGEVN